MKLSQRTYEAVKDIWQECIDHPFVKGIADSTIDRKKFIYYTLQDDLYIVEYAKNFAWGVIKAKKESDIIEFANLTPFMLAGENDMHRDYLHAIGVRDETIAKTKMNMVNHSYTSFMLNTASREGAAEIIAAILPCSWSYALIGEWVGKHADEETKKDPALGPWIEMYSSDEFMKKNDEIIAMYDRLSEGYTEEQMQHLIDIVEISSHYEKLFWDAAWNYIPESK